MEQWPTYNKLSVNIFPKRILRDKTWKVVSSDMKMNIKEGIGKYGKDRCINGVKAEISTKAEKVSMKLLEFKTWKSSRLRSEFEAFILVVL